MVWTLRGWNSISSVIVPGGELKTELKSNAKLDPSSTFNQPSMSLQLQPQQLVKEEAESEQ